MRNFFSIETPCVFKTVFCNEATEPLAEANVWESKNCMFLICGYFALNDLLDYLYLLRTEYSANSFNVCLKTITWNNTPKDAHVVLTYSCALCFARMLACLESPRSVLHDRKRSSAWSILFYTTNFKLFVNCKTYSRNYA